MKQFVVPQFIDVEDKIFGPITTRQFVILVVTGLIGFIQYKLFDFTLFLLVGVLTIVFGGLLAFFKVNGMPVHFFLLNLLQTSRRPKVRVWYRDVSDSELQDAIHIPIATPPPVIPHKPAPPQSRLQELSLQVDTGGSFKLEKN